MATLPHLKLESPSTTRSPIFSLMETLAGTIYAHGICGHHRYAGNKLRGHRVPREQPKWLKEHDGIDFCGIPSLHACGLQVGCWSPQYAEGFRRYSGMAREMAYSRRLLPYKLTNTDQEIGEMKWIYYRRDQGPHYGALFSRRDAGISKKIDECCLPTARRRLWSGRAYLSGARRLCACGMR